MGILFIFVIAAVILLIALAFWVGIFKLAYEYQKDKGIFLVLIHFFLAWGAVLLLYVLVVDKQPCRGFLCGLEDLLAFCFFGAVIVLFWPLGLLLYYRARFDKKK